MTTPRDGPCPCGSGKKYKNCCLRTHQREAARASEHRGAVERAIDWLQVRHPRALSRAIERGFLDSLPEERRDLLQELPTGLLDMFQINALDWLLAEGEIEIVRDGGTRKVRVRELLLGAGGPLLLAPQRAYLEEAVKTPLRVYEVIESQPGKGLVLRDVLEPERGDTPVQERLGSQSLVQWEIFGARVVRVGDHWELSGSIYAFGDAGRDVVKNLRETLPRQEPGTDEDRELAQRLLGGSIIASWLAVLTTPRQPPMPVDQGSGDPLMLVTDHYDVLDWDALAARLEAEPDVEGDRQESWTRFVELGDDMRRSLLAINIGQAKDRIEPFARTLKLADDGRAWLERVAGDSIRFVIRDMVDPMSIMKGGGPPTRPARSRQERARPDLTPEQMTQFHQQFAEKHYRNWADEKVPMLGDRTPREALETDSGRTALVDLLKYYEMMEANQARQDGRDPVDFGFLWAQVGLDRTRELITK